MLFVDPAALVLPIGRSHFHAVTGDSTAKQLLSRLVAYDTVSRNSNLEMVDFLCDYLDRPAVRINRLPSPDGRKASLVAVVGPEVDPDQREGVVLCGHTDVVPAEERDWHSEPFSLAERDQKLYGRGAADMKGFLALAVDRLRRLDPESLNVPVALLLTYDEEVGTLGAKDFVERYSDTLLPRKVLIGEPTKLQVARMHKGHLLLSLEIEGKAGHSGFPELGTNAIEPMGRAIVALSELRSQLEQERNQTSRFFGRVPFVTLNVAEVSGGVATNVIPDRCRLTIGIRLLPGMSADSMVDRVNSTIARAVDGADYRLVVDRDSPPMETSDNVPWYRDLCRHLGQEDDRSVYFATDGGWLSRSQFDCIICGPGDIDTAHQANEWIGLDELAAGGQLLDNIIEECRSSGAP